MPTIAMLDVPTECEFVLYRYGPFSFDLSDELTSFRSDELLELQLQALAAPDNLAALPVHYGAVCAGRALAQGHCKPLRIV